MKFAEPGIARVPSVTMRKSAASTGARIATPPIRVRSSVPARSQSRATMRKIAATTSPWFTICSTEPVAPSGRSEKIPIVMKPSCAIEE